MPRSILRKRTYAQRGSAFNRLYIPKSKQRVMKPRRRTYRKRRSTGRMGLMKYKRSLRRPVVGLEYYSVQFKSTLSLRVAPAVAANIMPPLDYGYQFRRFGVHTGGFPNSQHNTTSVFDCPGWVTHTQEWREFAIMGMKVQFQPLLNTNELQAGQTQQRRNPTMIVNNTWFDTLQDAVNGQDAGLYGPAQKYKPGSTVSYAQEFQRPTLQRHRPNGGWTKNVANNLYSKQQNLEWFQTKDFYSINIAGAYNPVCPASCPNPVLRHHLKFAEPFDPTQMWGPETVIGNYQVTYSVKFRGKIPKV